MKTPLDVPEQYRPTAPTCDFCEAPASYAYPVAEIAVDEETIPAAHWTTCHDCHRLIEDQDWDTLNSHAGYPPGFAPTPVTAFQEHRRGGAIPIVPA